jgi:hypothetical protein
MFWIPIAMTVLANVGYQMCAKTASSAHPLIGLAMTYLVALLTCLLLYLFSSSGQRLGDEIKHLTAANVALGFTIVLLESGFILAFRVGWSVGFAALISNALAALFLVPISIFYFHSPVGGRTFVGIATVLAGLWLIVM